MADPGLKIVVGADIGPAVTGLGRVVDALAEFAPAVSKATSGLNKIPAALKDVSNAAERVRNAASGPAGAFQKLNKTVEETSNTLNTKVVPGVNQASNALTNLGRVVQDAPFGFIGIQNNLNPLLESFQRLRTETGSNSAAFKSLLSSLGGAGGLGFALSLASSAFLIFGNSMHGAKKELEGFEKAIAEANKTAGDEIARVQVLNAVITDTTRKQSERSKAAQELSDILKDLNIKMDKEAILNSQVAEATKLATAAIIERAKARAAEARIGELAGQQLQRDLKRIEVTEKLSKAQKELATQEKINQQVIGGGSVPGIRGNTGAAALAVSNLKNEVAALDKATAEANKEIAFLLDRIKKDDLKLDIKGGKDEKAIDLLKQRIAALKELQGLTGLDIKQRVELAQLEIQLAKRDGAKLGFTKAEIQQQITGILEQAFPVGTFEFDTIVTTRVNKLEPSKIQTPKPLSEGQVRDIAKATGLDKITIPAPSLTFTNLERTAKDALNQINQAIVAIAQDIQVEAFSSIGEAIGAALTGGDAGSIFLSFFGFLADGLKQLGKALIAYGLALVGFKLAIATLNPVVAIIAGVAAIAAGSLVKASLPKFATGGIVTGPTIGQIGEMHRPEVVIPLDRLPQLFKQIGGDSGGGMQLIPIINNEGLYLAMKRGERSATRKF